MPAYLAPVPSWTGPLPRILSAACLRLIGTGLLLACLLLCPMAGRAVQLEVPGGFTLSPATVTAGQPVTGTLTLDAPAPSGGVTLAIFGGHDAPVSVEYHYPATVTIPAGQTSTTFTVTTGQVSYLTHFNFTATLDGVSQAATFTVTSAYLHVVRVTPTGITLAWDGQANGNFILDNGPGTPVLLTLPNSVHTCTVTLPVYIPMYSPVLFCIHDSSGPYSCFDLVNFTQFGAALGNQAVDSRLDLRYSTNVFLDHCFGTSAYRGGLFAGMATDPARVGRSFAIFNLNTPLQGSLGGGGTFRCGSVNAYCTGVQGASPTTVQIGCQTVAANLPDLSTLVWSTAPALTPSQAADVATIAYTPATPNPQWCAWALNNDIGNLFLPQSATSSLAVGWAAVDETQTGWAYFAKSEFDSTHAPSVTCAHSLPTLVNATLSQNSVLTSANMGTIPIYQFVTATVRVNGIGANTMVRICGSSDNAAVLFPDTRDSPGPHDLLTKGSWKVTRGFGCTFTLYVSQVSQPTVVHLTFTTFEAQANNPHPYDTVTVALTLYPPSNDSGGGGL